jgi:hypothetical protein
MSMHKALSTVAAILATCFIPAIAQQGRQLTADDYAHAEQFMAYNVNPLVYHTVSGVNWLPDGKFWFRDTDADGSTFLLVDPAKGTKTPAFDHAKLAAALTAAQHASTPLDPHHLALTNLTFAGSQLTVALRAGQFRCDLTAYTCAAVTDPTAATRRRGRAAADLSPDKTKAAFIRDWNLWLRDTATGKETQLTTDGLPDYGYATDNAGWTHSDSPILVWSPDSKKIATFQQDQRNVSRLHQQLSSHPQGLEVSARRRQGRHDDRARHHRRGLPPGRPPQDAPRPAPVYFMRRHQLPRRQRLGRRPMGPRRQDARLRLDLPRP